MRWATMERFLPRRPMPKFQVMSGGLALTSLTTGSVRRSVHSLGPLISGRVVRARLGQRSVYVGWRDRVLVLSYGDGIERPLTGRYLEAVDDTMDVTVTENEIEDIPGPYCYTEPGQSCAEGCCGEQRG